MLGRDNQFFSGEPRPETLSASRLGVAQSLSMIHLASRVSVLVARFRAAIMKGSISQSLRRLDIVDVFTLFGSL